MRKSDAFPSKYLAASDFDNDQTLTIKDWSQEEFEGDKGKENKVILHFEEVDKGFILNKTNWGSIEKIVGSDDTDDWIGKQITLGASEVQFGKDMVWSVRVRTPRPKGGGGFSRPQNNGNSGASATNSADVLKSAKADAWKRFTAKHIALPPSDQMTKLNEVVGKSFPGNTPSTLGIHQWQQLIKEDFEVVAPPFGDETEFKDDDIPF